MLPVRIAENELKDYTVTSFQIAALHSNCGHADRQVLWV